MSKLDALTTQGLELWPDAALVADADGVIDDVNERLCAMFRREKHELIGQAVEVLLPEHLRSSHRWYRERYAGDPVPRPMGAGLDLVAMRSDGTTIAVDVSLAPIRTDGDLFVLAAIRDVSERQNAEQILATSEERFRSIFEDNPVGMATVDEGHRITAANRALREMIGVEADELVGRTFEELSDAPADSATTHSLDGDRQLRRLDGQHRWGRFTTAPISGDGPHSELVVMVHDVTDEIAEQVRLAYMATHDVLTGLPNRSMLLDRLHQSLARSARRGANVGILYIDLDNFKQVNDTFGHPVGDAVLVEVARRTRAAIRPSDTAARIGGDELIVCCDDLPPGVEEASALAQSIAWRLRVELNEPIEIDGSKIEVGASIGIAVGSGLERTADSLIWEADTAMFREKARHRGTRSD